MVKHTNTRPRLKFTGGGGGWLFMPGRGCWSIWPMPRG